MTATFAPPAPTSRPLHPGPADDRTHFVAAPALAPACAFAFGVFLSTIQWFSPAWLLIGVVLLACTALAAAWHAPRVQLLPLAALFLVLGCVAAELEQPIDPQHELTLLTAQTAPQTVSGTIVRVESVRRSTYTAFFGHTSRAEITERMDVRLEDRIGANGKSVPLQGGLRLTLYADANATLPPVRCGSRLRVTLPLRPLSHYGDPGVWDAAAYMRSQGIGATATASVTDATLLAPIKPSFACRLHSLQSRASERVMSLAQLPAGRRLPPFLVLSEQDASMLTAMLTGDRTYLSQGTRTGFERTGSFHLLVVSGMHLAIFSSVVLLAARRLRLHRIAATLLTLLLSFCYALFTGYGEPVQRSFWMVALYLVGRLLFRERHALQALGLAALLLLAADPRALSGASLQMTLLTVVAIGGFATPLVERTFGPYHHALHNLWLVPIDASLPPRVAQWRVHLRLLAMHLRPITGRHLAHRTMPALLRFTLGALELFLVSTVVELVMALPMALYFHRVTVLGLPVNVLILPLLGLLLPAAMLCFAVLLVVPAAAVVPATLTAVLLHVVSLVVDVFSSIHFGDYRLPAPPSLRFVPWVVLLALGIALMRGRRPWVPATAIAALALAALLAVAPQLVRHPAKSLLVSAIDVGQGDAILVISPDGKTMLVDAGGIVGGGSGGMDSATPPSNALGTSATSFPGNSAASSAAARTGSTFDIGEDVVSPALWARGIRRLDAIAISHAHEDHIGGMRAVLVNFRPHVLLVGNNPRSAPYAALLAEAAQQGIPVERHAAGDRWRFGRDIEVQVLWPAGDYVPRATPGNNDSLVLRLTYGGTSALLEGDAEAPAERAMISAGLAHADLLKVGHHGSASSSIAPFLAAVSPSYGVISSGRRNYYGHPKAATLEHLQDAGVRTYRTDLLGETDFLLDGSHVLAVPWTADLP